MVGIWVFTVKLFRLCCMFEIFQNNVGHEGEKQDSSRDKRGYKKIASIGLTTSVTSPHLISLIALITLGNDYVCLFTYLLLIAYCLGIEM